MAILVTIDPKYGFMSHRNTINSSESESATENSLKMTPIVVAGEELVEIPQRTVLVGVEMDSQSRELLTWALVEVAQSGDRVIALHVLNENEVVDRDRKTSLVLLVKAFDSVLAVYEGFCNLKQDVRLMHFARFWNGKTVQWHEQLLVRHWHQHRRILHMTDRAVCYNWCSYLNSCKSPDRNILSIMTSNFCPV